MARRRGFSHWWLAGLVSVAACTAVASGRLDDLPSEEDTGTGGEGAIAKPGLRPLGAGCGEDDSVCASGFCSGGVCCDQACVGECQACNQIDVAGSCVAQVGQPCTDPSGGTCNAKGLCVPVDGKECTQDGQCDSGHCADGVCCDSACDGPCETCADHAPLPDGVCGPADETHQECGGLGCVAAGRCCGDSPDAPGGACPPECTGGCVGGTCVIACGADECKSTNITCPSGFDCKIECIGHHACQGTAIDCPTEHACDLSCDNSSDKNHACEEVTFTCTTGPCSMDCKGDEPCKNADVICGPNRCRATCEDDDGQPTVIVDNSPCSLVDTCDD